MRSTWDRSSTHALLICRGIGADRMSHPAVGALSVLDLFLGYLEDLSITWELVYTPGARQLRRYWRMVYTSYDIAIVSLGGTGQNVLAHGEHIKSRPQLLQTTLGATIAVACTIGDAISAPKNANFCGEGTVRDLRTMVRQTQPGKSFRCGNKCHTRPPPPRLHSILTRTNTPRKSNRPLLL